MMEISVEQYNKMAERLTELEYELAKSVEVVRCKDCKYRDPEDERCDHGSGGLYYADDRPSGEWVEKEVMVDEDASITEWQSAKCSVCGKYHTTPYMYYFEEYKYCPNCGKKMKRREL